MFCNKCGAALPDGSQFCNGCGAALGGQPAPAQRKKEKWESKTEQCHPELENRLIKIYEAFGWEVQSTQEIYSKDSHTEGRFTGTYSVTETTNYVKITFRRDQNMPNYKRIVELEEEYNQAMNTYPEKPGKWLLYLGFFGLLIYGLGVIAIGCYIWKLIDYKKKYKEHDALADEVAERTMSEADKLMSE